LAAAAVPCFATEGLLTNQRFYRRPVATAILCCLGVAGVVSIEIPIVNGANLLRRPFWFDEFCTLFVASRGDWQSSITALSNGADYNPPLLFLSFRFLHLVGLPLEPEPMRIVGFACVCIALVLIVWILAPRVGTLPALAGAAAVATLGAAFDARYYGPMLLFAAGVAAVVDARRTSTATRAAWLFLLGAGLCSLHWFGVIVLGLAGLALVYQCISSRSAPLWALGLIGGPLATLVWLPLFRGQRSALTAPTWVEPATVRGSFGFIEECFGASGVLFVAFALALVVVTDRFFGRPPTRPLTGTPRAERASGSYVLLAYGLMPIGLAMISFAFQPVMVPRYAVVAGLGVGAVVAYSLGHLRDRYAVVASALFLLISGLRLRGLSRAAADFEADITASIRSVTSHLPEGAGVVAVSAHAVYPLVSPLQRARYKPALVDFTHGEEVCGRPGTNAACDGLLIERDVSRVHRRLFGFPPLVSLDSLRAQELAYVIEREDPRYRRYDSTLAARMLPGFTPTRIAPTLYRFARVHAEGGSTEQARDSHSDRDIRRDKGTQ
jgi:hypothetical protein